jgi:hypothetical protein
VNSEAGNIRPTVGTREISGSRAVDNRDERRRRRRRDKEEAQEQHRPPEPEPDVRVELSDMPLVVAEGEADKPDETTGTGRVDYLA